MDKMSTIYEMYVTLVNREGELAANIWLENNLDEQEIESLMKYIERVESRDESNTNPT